MCVLCVRVCNTFLFRVADVRVEEASVCVRVCVCAKGIHLVVVSKSDQISPPEQVWGRQKWAKYVIHMTKCEKKC